MKPRRRALIAAGVIVLSIAAGFLLRQAPEEPAASADQAHGLHDLYQQDTDRAILLMGTTPKK